MDLRTQKVYDALIEAFQQLLTEKPFEDITVNELCDRARTRRATFYKHFSDKYDFFQFMLRQLRDDLMRETKERAVVDTPQEYLHMFVDIGLSFVEKHRKFLMSVKDSAVAGQMMQTITDQGFREQHFEYLLEDELAVQFLVGGLNQCVRWWLSNMNRASKEDMQKTMYALVDKYTLAVQ